MNDAGDPGANLRSSGVVVESFRQNDQHVGRCLDGHIVQGHVDGIGTIVSIERLSDSFLCRIAFDPACTHLLIPAGSVAVDGISFTVARLDETTFTVSVIPHTCALTNAGSWEAGGRVNLEFDPIGKYIAKGMETDRIR